MIFPEYKKLMKQAESFSLDERVKANNELEKFKNEEPRQAWYYNKWLQDEQQGKDTFSTKQTTQKPSGKPVEAVNTARVSNTTKTMQTATKGKDKPKSKPMSYEQFLKEFNALDKSNLFRADGKSPMVRLSEFSREHPDLYAKYRDQMRENDD